MSQLSLALALRDSATFDNFYAANNQQVIHALQDPSESFVYLWGGEGTGKSHLLQASCHHIAQQGGTPAYLPLSQWQELSPAYLEGLETMDLVCIDDIEQIAGQGDWEEALFHLYNRVRDSQCRLLVAAKSSPTQLPLQLPDLRSRLAWGLVLQLNELDDEDKLACLQLRAHNRGFELPTEVGHYLLKRSPRNMEALLQLLERLDQASLSAQRKLTIPFVRELI